MKADMNNFIGGKYKPLTEQDIKAVYAASLKILSETGFLIKSQRALEILDSKGANVDYEKMLARERPDIVSVAIPPLRAFGKVP